MVNVKHLGTIILISIIILILYFTAFLTPVVSFIAEGATASSYAELAMALSAVIAVIAPIIIMMFIDVELPLWPFVALAFTLMIVWALVHNIVVIPASGATIADVYVEHVNSPLDVNMTRIVPLKTAYAYAISMLQTPTHTIYYDESYIYYNGTIPIYNWIVEPEGFPNEVARDAEGVVFVEGEYPPKVKYIKHDLYWSLHRARFSFVYMNLYYQLKFMRMSDVPLMSNNIEVVLNNTVYVLIPFKTWVKTWTTSIPVLSGYAVIREDGKMWFVPADKLMDDPVTREALKKYRIPIVPEAIAREWIELLRWSPGFWDVALFHRTFEIRDVGANPQPYLVFDDNGNLWWLFVAEPSGESYAVKYLIYVNASSVEPHIIMYSPKKTWFGASKVEEYVVKAHPTYDWSLFELAEPIPMVVNGTLYWKVTIITSDGRGVVSIDLVNAETGEVYSIPVEKSLTIRDFYTFIETTILYKQPVPQNETTTEIAEIIQKIRELKQQISQLQETLENMYAELERLEELINSTRT